MNTWNLRPADRLEDVGDLSVVTKQPTRIQKRTLVREGRDGQRMRIRKHGDVTYEVSQQDEDTESECMTSG